MHQHFGRKQNKLFKLCAASDLANSDPTSGINSSSAGNVNCNCCSRFLSSTSSRVLVLVVRLTAVPGASLAQLFPAACAASPAVQRGSSLCTSLLAGIVRSGALSNTIFCTNMAFKQPCAIAKQVLMCSCIICPSARHSPRPEDLFLITCEVAIFIYATEASCIAA